MVHKSKNYSIKLRKYYFCTTTKERRSPRSERCSCRKSANNRKTANSFQYAELTHFYWNWSSTDNGLVFSGKISNAPFAHVLKLWRHVTLQSPNSLEKSEIRRYFDYCGIISTEYKWTTWIFRQPVILILNTGIFTGEPTSKHSQLNNRFMVRNNLTLVPDISLLLQISLKPSTVKFNL